MSLKVVFRRAQSLARFALDGLRDGLLRRAARLTTLNTLTSLTTVNSLLDPVRRGVGDAKYLSLLSEPLARSSVVTADRGRRSVEASLSSEGVGQQTAQERR